jgi:hypothetical protein
VASRTCVLIVLGGCNLVRSSQGSRNSSCISSSCSSNSKTCSYSCSLELDFSLQNSHMKDTHGVRSVGLVAIDSLPKRIAQQPIGVLSVDCAVWSVVTRCLEVGDNACQVGSVVLGRSSVFRIRAHCRQRVALCMADGLYPLRIYTNSKWSPADRPSRRHLRSVPRSLDANVVMFTLHLFRGPRKAGDFQHRLQFLGWGSMWLWCLWIWFLMKFVLDDVLFSLLRRFSWSVFFDAGVFGFPCNAISRSRRRPCGPPRSRTVCLIWQRRRD